MCFPRTQQPLTLGISLELLHSYFIAQPLHPKACCYTTLTFSIFPDPDSWVLPQSIPTSVFDIVSLWIGIVGLGLSSPKDPGFLVQTGVLLRKQLLVSDVWKKGGIDWIMQDVVIPFVPEVSPPYISITEVRCLGGSSLSKEDLLQGDWSPSLDIRGWNNFPISFSLGTHILLHNPSRQQVLFMSIS